MWLDRYRLEACCHRWFRFVYFPLTFLIISTLVPTSQAQIRLDGSLGPSGEVTGPDYMITAEMGKRHGGNLFHSFSQFNIASGEQVTFTGPAAIDTILSRVTGNSPSTIHGLLQSDIPGASLYLLNPNGVVFGANAELKIDGSFHVSTADVLRFADGNTFAADLSETSALTVASPTAFGFTRQHPASIVFQGSELEIEEGQTFSITGGDITVTSSESEPDQSAFLAAEGGHLHIASVASPGEVKIQMTDDILSLVVDEFTGLGTVMINRAEVTARQIQIRADRVYLDGESRISTRTEGAEPGTIDIQAEHIQLDGESRISGIATEGRGGVLRLSADTIILNDKAEMINRASGMGQGGDVQVTAQVLTLNAGTRLGSESRLNSLRDAGNIVIEAKVLRIHDGGAILGTTSGTGRGGHITIAADRLIMDGFGEDRFGRTRASRISANSSQSAIGDAGNIQVYVQDMRLTHGAQIQSATSGAGRGGNVTVEARGAVVLDGVNRSLFPSLIAASSLAGATGAAGDVQVVAQDVTLTGGAQIQSATFGAGHGGTVMVNARDTVTVDGFGDGILSLISASSDLGATGDAGRVEVTAQTVQTMNGGQINSVTFGSGRGGNVTVTAADMVVFSGTSPEGEIQGGVLVPGDVTFPSGAFVNSHGSGAPGVVQVEAPIIRLVDGGRISSLTLDAESGGRVSVQAHDVLVASGSGSGLLAQSTGAGTGGDIIVEAGVFDLSDDASVSSRSSGSGNAGTIAIAASESFLMEASQVTTEATQASGGDIRITTPSTVRIRDSRLTAEVRGAEDTVGGNLNINAEFIIAKNSQIVADANEGTGGRIELIAAQAVILDANSSVTASSNLGIDGTVEIKAPVTALRGAVTPLPRRFAQAESLIQRRCFERLSTGGIGSFIAAGRNRIPTDPASVLASPMVAPARVPTPLGIPGQVISKNPLLHLDQPAVVEVRERHVERWNRCLASGKITLRGATTSIRAKTSSIHDRVPQSNHH